MNKKNVLKKYINLKKKGYIKLLSARAKLVPIPILGYFTNIYIYICIASRGTGGGGGKGGDGGGSEVRRR